MGKIYELKGYFVKYYGKFSKYIDKALKFIVALITFTYISKNIGFSGLVANPIMTILLSVICMLLPFSMTMVIAAIAVVIQIMSVSMGMAIVAIGMFVILYALYFRFSPEKSVVLLLTPIAFMLQIPIVIPIVFGLIGGTICILPVTAGTMIYYMVEYVKTNANMLQTTGETAIIKQITAYSQQFLMNKEMWCVIIAFAVTLLLVYGVRRMSVDHSWEIAVIAGVLGNVNIMAYGYIILDIQISYVSLIIGSVIAIIVALIVKLFAFSVDYTRTEYLQFEDDEYYYYVKAVPKNFIAEPKKTVKKIASQKKQTKTIKRIDS